ncbi:MAG TPA: mannitol dehydrogenase family protein [Pelagibacterium sp.]|uniref:mannitol dehydrogenase family protein n=1 Tax=Pelagibacterium sp. TaxID=1967288 RepID=UPI002C609789|nr:mannitol dehydrogenase family protein [Pelagibacterium sp.]HWJ86841.1 mannitol dehydrogenase family protein [Pelagibacterium sp.]
MDRLDNHSLGHLREGVESPAYERSAVTAGIVHLGIGAFHRAHMAAYVDKCLAEAPQWGIVGASFRSPDTRNALEPQDYLYCLLTRETKGNSARVIGSVIDIIDASQSSRDLIAKMANPAVRIISLTVTEKGYCYDPVGGGLDRQHPAIVRDLAADGSPHSVPGVIVAALASRRAEGLGGFTVLSCDNLPSNGRVTRRVVMDFAALVDPALAEWIGANVSFPSTMVDRIVPSTSDRDRDDVAAMIGARDAWPVVAEAFSQWVVEDDFVAGRPDWEHFGVQMVSDVEPFEHMKLRMLNGSHSTLAYLGLPCGFTLVSEAASDPDLRVLIERMFAEEIAPTLSVPDIDLGAYGQALIVRYTNWALEHRLAQIAMDGTQKLPQRLIATLLERAETGQSFHFLALAVAGWIAFIVNATQKGATIDDPLSDRLQAASRNGDDPDQTLENFLEIGEVFPLAFARNQTVRSTTRDHLDALLRLGAPAAIKRALSR